MDSKTLEQVIRQYIPLPIRPSGRGWYPVLCRVCNDHGKKGPRGGFKFEDGTVAYHCFNCGPEMNTVYTPDLQGREGQPIFPPKMAQVLEAFGVPEDEWKAVVFSSMSNRENGHKTHKSSNTIKSIEPTILHLPQTFYPLKDADANDKWAIIANYYLEEERGIDPSKYPFYLSKQTNDPHLKKWYGRLIIPIYKGDNLIFYQGRDLTNKAKKKYESPPDSRDNVLFGFDQLFINRDIPLYVAEGVFDAMMIDGVAILSNDPSKAQIEWLNRSPRKKVYIPDRFGSGRIGAEKALKAGWKISIPDTPDCKDINEAVRKYGKLYVMKSLVENTFDGFEAQVRMGILIE